MYRIWHNWSQAIYESDNELLLRVTIMAFAQKINRVYNDQLCPGSLPGMYGPYSTEQENVVLDMPDRVLARANISKRVGQSSPWGPGFGQFEIGYLK